MRVYRLCTMQSVKLLVCSSLIGQLGHFYWTFGHLVVVESYPCFNVAFLHRSFVWTVWISCWQLLSMFSSTDKNFPKFNKLLGHLYFPWPFEIGWSFLSHRGKMKCHILSVHKTWWYCRKRFYQEVKINKF